MRLTKDVIEQLLRQNEGFKHVTHYSGKNFAETRCYEIVEGTVKIISSGKTSWADSRFTTATTADLDQVRRFLRSVLHRLDASGLK